MMKIVGMMLIIALGLMAENNVTNETSKQDKNVSAQEESAFVKSLKSLFEVRDPDHVDNKKSFDNLFTEKK